jgi:hypothetical protein
LKKIHTDGLLIWDARYVGIKAMKEHQQNCIIFGELASEALRLLSRYAPTITEDQIPVFTEWGEKDLKGNMLYLKNSYLDKHWNS